MQSLNQSLEKLVRRGVVTLEEAKKVSPNPDELEMFLAGISRKEGY
jgi:Tfp pilus assembly pilus retraction ATPase PilT